MHQRRKWDKAVKFWNTLFSDPNAHFDKEIFLKAEDIAPVVVQTSPKMSYLLQILYQALIPGKQVEKAKDL